MDLVIGATVKCTPGLEDDCYDTPADVPKALTSSH